MNTNDPVSLLQKCLVIATIDYVHTSCQYLILNSLIDECLYVDTVLSTVLLCLTKYSTAGYMIPIHVIIISRLYTEFRNGVLHFRLHIARNYTQQSQTTNPSNSDFVI